MRRGAEKGQGGSWEMGWKPSTETSLDTWEKLNVIRKSEFQKEKYLMQVYGSCRARKPGGWWGYRDNMSCFFSSKLQHTCRYSRFPNWTKGERRVNYLMGHFMFRKLMLLVELVASDKHFKAIYSSFIDPKSTVICLYGCVNAHV